jgi:hypothetical protein
MLNPNAGGPVRFRLHFLERLKLETDPFLFYKHDDSGIAPFGFGIKLLTSLAKTLACFWNPARIG